MSESGTEIERGKQVPDSGQPPRHIELVELFLLFSQLGLTSFGGGVSAWVHRAFVEQRRLIGESEFAAAFALSRIVPGANVINLAVVLGQRLRGFGGACAALLGIMLGPTLAVIAIAALYRRFGGSPALQAALEGTAAAAVGLMIAMGLQSAARLVRRPHSSGRHIVQSLGGATVLVVMLLSVGVLRLPMIPTVLCLAPLSIALAFLTRDAEKPDAGR